MNSSRLRPMWGFFFFAISPPSPSGPLSRNFSEPLFGGLNVLFGSLLALLLGGMKQHHFAAHHHDVEHPLLRRLDLPQLAPDLSHPDSGCAQTGNLDFPQRVGYGSAL